MKLRLLDLFSGIGGFSLGLERSGFFETVAFCEIEEFPRRVLAKHWPKVPCYHDIRELTGDRLVRDGIAVDAICGGFPCQDISSSGPRTGLAGKKSGLWTEIFRLICEIRPAYAIMENVSALVSRGLGRVLRDLASIGYDAQWRCGPAFEFGIPQARDRIWIVAYPCSSRQSSGDEWHETVPQYLGWADDDGLGAAQSFAKACADYPWRADYGIPDWIHRLRSLGNAVVPQIPEIIGRAIGEYEAGR